MCTFLVCCKGGRRLVEVVLTAHMQLSEICIWIFLAESIFAVKGKVVKFMQYASIL